MSFIGFNPAGAFKTISSAFQTSTNASSLVAGASGLLAESRESRRSTAGLEGGLAESTSKLLALKGEMASSPNLTPVINQVKIQSGFLTSPPHASGLQEGPAVLGKQKPPPAVTRLSSVRHGRTKSLSRGRLINSIQATSGDLSEHPLPGDHRQRSAAHCPLPGTRFFLQGLSHVSVLVSQRPT